MSVWRSHSSYLAAGGDDPGICDGNLVYTEETAPHTVCRCDMCGFEVAVSSAALHRNRRLAGVEVQGR